MKKEPFLIDVYEGEYENFITDFSEYEVVEYEQEDYTFNENDNIPSKQDEVEEKEVIVEQDYNVDFVKNKEWNESLDEILEKEEKEENKSKINAQLTEITNKLSRIVEILDSVFKTDF